MVCFAHMADVHIGSWRDPKMRALSMKAFTKACMRIKQQQVDFLLIAGDFFHTALPGIDLVKAVVKELKQLKQANIPVYCIPGSHDFSSAGKSMLEVLEEAELLTNVCKGSVQDGKLHLQFVTDPKTHIKITGMLGRRGLLDRAYYEDLARQPLEQEPGTKIFLFHTAISELKPKGYEGMDACPISLLPDGFSYYAGGHVHEVLQTTHGDQGQLAYPGPLFPDTFAELEHLQRGGYWLYQDGKLNWETVQVKNTAAFTVSADQKTPQQVQAEIEDSLRKQEFIDTIVLLRVKGRLASGTTSDIDFKAITTQLYDKGAYFVMRNTVKLESPGFETITTQHASPQEVEDHVLQEHIGQVAVDGWDIPTATEKAKALLQHLDTGKGDGETVPQFEERLRAALDAILKPE